MSWFDRLLGRKDAQALTSLPDFLMMPSSKSGQQVNYATALAVTTVLACCRVIAEGIAQVPCRLRKPKTGGGSVDATEHPLFRLLYRRPNFYQTAFEFWETLLFHLVLVGNAFVFISRVGGRVHELLIIEPGKVIVKRRDDLSLEYQITGEDGSLRYIPASDIWHLRGPSWNSWMGMEAVKLAREAIGLSLALEEAHARLHQNGIQPSGIYSVEGTLKPEDHQKLVSWLKKSAAAANAGTPLVLDRAAKWMAQQMSGVDAQHVETRRLQIEENCRALRVMPIMVGAADKVATYASSEQMFLAHVIHTLMPWGTRLEQSAEANLLTDKEQADGLFFKFYFQALMRGDFKGRQEGLQIMRRNGIINADEWRDLEDMNPRTDEGGAQYIVEANMALQDGRDLPPPRPNITVS
ncbi:phage portal protein [Bradyrhizobium sp.]|uniref:phage portal protein n=1 Tax=Bradyrhizobium sp. TaxID=376 RepID=UPI0025BF86C3|nr:phage portal protein [Bradyrhizobium sp.]MCA3254940.1 phage portal protein [Alphaproteobacteria bacterium]MCA3568379.1 phage portal protein [Bradyrhizobium sp.]